MTTETERTALVERHALALMDDGSPSGPDECRYVTLAMVRSTIAAAVADALASAPSAPPLQEPAPSTCEGGVTVRWCPRCGTCTCPALTGAETDWPEDPFCPIHGTRSTHEEPSAPQEDDPDPLMQELYDAIEAMPYADSISSEDASFPDRLIAIVKLHSEVQKEPSSSSQGQERTALIERPAIEHELKTWREYFDAVSFYGKQFEVRRDDRDFRTGDTVRLREWDDATGYSGRQLKFRIGYVLRDFVPGNVVFALEALSSSAPAEADLAELPDGPCLGPSACNESFGRLLNLLHERGYCETCEGTGTMQAVCGFDPVKGEITTPEVCGECHGVAGKALKIRDFEELRVDVGSRVAVVYGAFSDLNDLCHRFSIAAPSQTPEERPASPTREELIGYLAQCYRATGSIQTAGCHDEEVAGLAVDAVQMLARRTQRGVRFDPDTRSWIAREIVTTAARTEDEAREALKSAIRLLADTWPPRDPATIVDALAAIGSEVLCETCAKVFCPHGERLHFHHDGCPACDANDHPLLPSCVIGEYCRRHQFVHGSEAEELRSKIEAILEAGAVSDQRLRDLLDEVDARDSLALLETGTEERPAGETPEPSLDGLVMTAKHYLGADFGTPPPDKRASFLLAGIHHLGGALRGMVEAYRMKADAYERMRANYETSAGARTVRSIATMLGWENVPPQDVLEDEIRALKARVQEAQPSPAPPDPIAAAVDAHLDPLKDELIAMGHRLAKDVVCEHGTAMDVHCCNCHSGFLFDLTACSCVYERQYPCGCSAVGPNVPASCPEHGQGIAR
jgi:hypothetical protein